NEVLLHILAFRIATTRDELTIASLAQDHIAPALWTKLFERNIGHAFALVEPARGLALRITGAGHELAEASALEDHRASAVLAVFFLRRLLEIGVFQIGKIDRVFFGERAAIGIFLVVGAAGEERTEFAPL